MNEITIQELSPLAREYALHLDPDSPANREMIELDCIGFVNKLLETYSLVRKITSAPQTAANDNTLEAAAREYVAHTEPLTAYTSGKVLSAFIAGARFALSQLNPEKEER